ncbi:SAM-dependent methyltransferase [Ramlibacter sp. MAHUQ-53]|uniref:SAM-dependent methyltransferase n=1 Tax=unclassified Ramlibacter TaxID=2617605 RepID=UPI0036253863
MPAVARITPATRSTRIAGVARTTRHLAALALAAAALAALPARAQAPQAAPAVPAQPAFLDEVPFITTPDHVTLEMLSIAGVGAADHVIDLGSGDGRIVVTAARRFGATGLGVEIVPDLVERSERAARLAGVSDKAKFKVQDLFETDLTPASVITMYLLPDFNLKLRPLLLALKPGTRVVSHDWDMGDWAPDETRVLAVPDKAVGREKQSKVHFWVVPARVEGLWCGVGPLTGSSLRLAQRYQEVTGQYERRGRVREIQARLRGAVLRTQETRDGALELQAEGDALVLRSGPGPLALARGATFRRTAGERCA